MKHLKSRVADLKNIFENQLTVSHISENLISRDGTEPSACVKKYMKEKDFDVVGLKENGTVVGYIKYDELGNDDDACRKHNQLFSLDELVADSTPLLEIVKLLKNQPRYFILTGNEVVAIVMRGDLQKTPVRMLLFGLVTLLEMNLLRTILYYYPESSWKRELKNERLEKASKLFEERKKRNENIGLADCLELSDKFDLIIKRSCMHKKLEFSKTKLKDLKESIGKQRNILAHGHDLVSGSSWEEVIESLTHLDHLLESLERLNRENGHSGQA